MLTVVLVLTKVTASDHKRTEHALRVSYRNLPAVLIYELPKLVFVSRRKHPIPQVGTYP